MMVLDTNTLYYACGLSTPPMDVDKNKLLSTISTTEDVVISYVTLAEFLTKHRKHARIIRRTCSYMRDNHIRVIGCEYMPMDRQFIMLLTKIRQKNFNKKIERIFDTKIDIESRMASAIFIVLLVCETTFECNIDPMNLTAPAFGFLSNLFKILRETFVPVFNELYRDAYKTDDAENYIRRGIYRLLDTFIPVLMPLCQKVIKDINDSEEPNEIDTTEIINNFKRTEWENATEIYHRRINKQRTPMYYVQRSGITYGKGINDKPLKALLGGLGKSIEKIVGQNALNEYLFDILKKSITQGGAFRKNDINDALILCTLKANDIIISFDNGMINHLKERSNTRTEYKNSVVAIEELRIKT